MHAAGKKTQKRASPSLPTHKIPQKGLTYCIVSTVCLSHLGNGRSNMQGFIENSNTRVTSIHACLSQPVLVSRLQTNPPPYNIPDCLHGDLPPGSQQCLAVRCESRANDVSFVAGLGVTQTGRFASTPKSRTHTRTRTEI